MKTLTVIRHAKAVPAEDHPNDFERTLTKRGQKDSKLIAQFLRTIKPSVDWMISSPALRARETAELVAAALGYPNAITWEDKIYLAEADQLLTILGNTPAAIEHAVIIGHNPGMTDLIAGLTAGGNGHANLHVPTAALAHIALEIFWWEQIRWGCGQLQLLIAPKFL